MDNDLVCNFKKCRKRLDTVAWVTACSRILFSVYSFEIGVVLSYAYCKKAFPLSGMRIFQFSFLVYLIFSQKIKKCQKIVSGHLDAEKAKKSSILSRVSPLFGHLNNLMLIMHSHPCIIQHSLVNNIASAVSCQIRNKLEWKHSDIFIFVWIIARVFTQL